MLDATPGAEIAMYSNLCRLVREHGIQRVLRMMLQKSHKWIILLQDPFNKRSGHWMGLNILPSRREIYFFSSYGGKPDAEKLQWIPNILLVLSDQDVNALNDGLYEMKLWGWKVHYNDHPYQFPGDRTATCGIWTSAFLNSDLNPDQFWDLNKNAHVGAEDYFRMYFR